MTEPRGTVAKIRDSHRVMTQDGSDMLFVDRHYLHEGSHHAFGFCLSLPALWTCCRLAFN